MSQQQHDEIDLVYVIGKLKQTVKNWISLAFKALDYALKYWYVILILAIVGFGIGYYKVKDAVNPQKSTVIVKINYNLQPYVMNAIELYNNKAMMYDSIFLKSMGYSPYNPQIKEVLLEPVVDFKDIIEKYQINERGLDMLLNRVDFDDEELPIQDRNQEMKNELALSSDITVPIHEVMIRKGEPRLLSKKHIVYPILLVFLFLFFSYLRYLYFYFRSIAREVNN